MTVEQADRENGEADGTGDALDEAVSAGALIDALPEPIYVLDADNTIVGWSEGLDPLLGLSGAEMLGTDEYFGRNEDGERIKTLGNKVVEDDETPHVGDERVTKTSSEYAAATVFENDSWIVNDAGEERFIRFQAVPIYDDQGELQAVVQVCRDETAQRQKQEATEALVEEVNDTVERLSQGDLSARVSFEQDEHVESHLLEVVSRINDMAANLESLVGEIDGRTDSVEESADSTAELAASIADLVEQQTAKLDESVDELEEFSARMEEVAANSDQVATAAESARDAVETGLSAGGDAADTADQLTETGDTLVETVSALEADMGDIEDVVEMIQDVADQTNMLALNASIEAARAEEGSGGFGVVADEIKELAEETSANADRINEQIEGLRSRADETISVVEQANDEMTDMRRQVTAVMDALEQIDEQVAEVSRSIQEIADANDQQAKTIESLTDMLQDVQSQAEDARSASQSIVEQTDRQQTAVSELHREVAEITAGREQSQ